MMRVTQHAQASPMQYFANNDEAPLAVVTMSSSKPGPAALTPAPLSFADLVATATVFLPPATLLDFTNTIKYITRLGGRNLKGLESRRAQLQEIAMGNVQVLEAYNQYATGQRGKERRITYRLPVFGAREQSVEIVEEIRSDSGATEDRHGRVEVESMSGDTEADEEDGSRTMLLCSEKTKYYDQYKEEERVVKKVRMSIDGQTLNVGSSPIKPPTPRLLIIESTDVPRIDYLTRSKPHSSFIQQSGTILPVRNHENFPTQRIREAQFPRYPSTTVTRMAVHCDASGTVTQVTAEIRGGSVDYLLINNPRIITALGFDDADHDTLTLNEDVLYLDETFNIVTLPHQDLKDLNVRIIGELLPARHPYLDWLDLRQSANPKTPPFLHEAKEIANMNGQAEKDRRWYGDVWRELQNASKMELGSGGRKYREGREKWLGESPTYPEGAEKRAKGNMYG